jgi:hypothetical protein
VPIYDGTNSWDNKTIGGDASLAANGDLTVSTIGGTVPILTGDAASGDLGGTYPSPTVNDDSHDHTSTTLTLGSIKTLSDVNSSMSPGTGEVLGWTGSQWTSVAAGSSSLAGLSDTNISSLAGGQILIYDGATYWVNKTTTGDVQVNASGAIDVLKIRGNAVANDTAVSKDFMMYSSTSGGYINEEHYWNKVYNGSLSSSTSISLSSTYIAGNTQQIIRIHIWGYWNTSSADRYMYLRFNNDTGSNYGSYYHYHGYEAGIGDHHSSGTYAYGTPGQSSQFGFNAWARPCDFTCTLTIYPEVNNTRIRQCHSEFMWIDNDGSDVTGMQQRFMINWKNTSSNITSIQLYLNGGGTANVSGHYYVESLVRKLT